MLKLIGKFLFTVGAFFACNQASFFPKSLLKALMRTMFFEGKKIPIVNEKAKVVNKKVQIVNGNTKVVNCEHKNSIVSTKFPIVNKKLQFN